MKTLKILLRFCLLWLPFCGLAQDPQFSQFYLSSLDINPANTGRMEVRARITALYRTQWNTILGTKSYQSAYAAYESQISCLPDGFFAIGVVGKYDRVGDIKLTRKYGHLSLAYHHELDKRGKYLSAGFQLGIISSRFQLNQLQFDEQFDGVGFNASLPTFEDLLAIGNNVMDLNIGLSYYQTKRLTLGAALYHVTQPNNTFFDNTDFRVGLGLGLHASFLSPDSPFGLRVLYRRQSLVEGGRERRAYHLLEKSHIYKVWQSSKA